MSFVHRGIVSLFVFAAVGCGSGGSSTDGSAGGGGGGSAGSGGAVEPYGDLTELEATGLFEYFGRDQPTGTRTGGGYTIHDFDPADGPVCLRGAPFYVATREGASDNLLIYLQGGGACFPFLCGATEAPPEPDMLRTDGILDPDDPANPVADWDVVYVPYCDGSVFAGDAEIPDGADMAGARTHFGRRNLSASLDVAKQVFPNPPKVLFAGSSAGGNGVSFNGPLARHAYPTADYFVMNDAGLGLNTRLEFMKDSWSTRVYEAPSCSNCETNPHATALVGWHLEHDPNVVIGVFSSWEDAVIRAFSQPDPVVFRQMVADETGALSSAFPDRYKRFIIEGEQHTALLSSFHETKVGATTLAQWVGAMIDREPGWVDAIE